MKTKILLVGLLIVQVMLFEACNSVYEGPKKGKPGTVISISDREISSALTIMDSLTIRSKLFNGDVYTLSISGLE